MLNTISRSLRHAPVRFSALLLASAAFSSCASIPVEAETATPVATADEEAIANVSELTAGIDIPYSKFVLDNGLTVLVNEDHKAPVVALSVWYDVGSANEPEGKTGYAHLFEHIMFNGSENAPDDYFQYTKKIGATSLNGTTWLDRTNYYETVPKAALESALFLESDRMGNLLGAVTQEKLDNQIGVVQNEKRQGDNQPMGLLQYDQAKMLFPEGHPYHHTTIGSMEDLQAATLDDIATWFKDHYAPNNAILALSGDITVAEAKPLVEKWFGRFPRGPEVKPVAGGVPTLAERERVDFVDQVATPHINYNWTMPGLNDPDFVAVDAGATILGGLSSSRLDKTLVRGEKLAVSVGLSLYDFVLSSIMEVDVAVAPGVDPDMVQKRLDEVIAEFIAEGPTEEELKRVQTTTASSYISSLESISGKASTLASGELYSDDPEHYKKNLAKLAALTPEKIQAAMQKWLTRPVLEFRVMPGERPDTGEGGAIAAPEDKAEVAADTIAAEASEVDPALATMPAVGEVGDLDLPDVQTTTLDNGIKLHFAARDTVPVVRVSASFDAGYAADPTDEKGLAAMTLNVMAEGTANYDADALRERSEELGASISASSSLDDTDFNLRALEANLSPSLDLFAEMIKQPAFREDAIEQIRTQQLTAIQAELKSPQSLALRVLPPLLYGSDHPYGTSFTGSGEPEVVAEISRDDMQAWKDKWITPSNMTLFAVGDSTLAEMRSELNARFGNWTAAPDATVGSKTEPAMKPTSPGKIIVFNRPGSPQSLLLAGQLTSLKGGDEQTAIDAANEVLGGDFLSRINMDLRETKGWSYGTATLLLQPKGQMPFIAFAPVQADRTGDSYRAILDQMKSFFGDDGVTPAERDRVVNGVKLELAGKYQSAGALLNQMESDAKYDRPFDYAEGTVARYSALTPEGMTEALKGVIDPSKLTWIIVGDASVIKPQLEGVKVPIEYRTLDN